MSSPPQMPTKPEFQDFGITPEQYAVYKGEGGVSGFGPLLSLGSIPVVAVVVFVNTRDLSDAIGWGIAAIFPALFAGAGIEALIGTLFRRYSRSRLLNSPFASQIKLYEEAEESYQAAQQEAVSAEREAERLRLRVKWEEQQAEKERLRTLAEHWLSLSGPEFERELGTLYRRIGYQVQLTPSSGDEGIDLVLMKGGKRTLVQCKSHRRPVGPAVARELYGALIHFGADSAILACTGGFTRGVNEFVRDKPIALVSASELAALGDIVSSGSATEKRLEIERLTLPTETKTQMRNDGVQDGSLVGSAPVCPMPGCRKTMVLREGYRGEFWGCPRFPKCRGTRNI